VLHFWATWCPPCRQELPVFNRIYRKYQGRGVVFLVIAVTDKREAVAKYLRDKGFDFTSALDSRGASIGKYKSRYLPTTVTVDGAGNIVKKHIGQAKEAQWTEMMEQLLAAGSQQSAPDPSP
jgi:thiol-disulfide isomerase/thioredoxin